MEKEKQNSGSCLWIPIIFLVIGTIVVGILLVVSGKIILGISVIAWGLLTIKQ